MPFLIFILAPFAIVFFIRALMNLGRSIWSSFDHSSWDKASQPSFDAKIVDIDVEQVKYAKNDAKFKTTILFSDGFWFTTHRTNKEQHLLSYDISVDKNEIIHIANNAHTKAVAKKMKNTPM